MYPRNYYLTEPIPYLTKDERFYIDFIQKKKRENKKILFYLPTFRKHQLQFLGITDLEKINLFFDFLDDHGYFLMTKIHTGGYYSNNDTIADSVKERILSLPPQTDIYPFLKETDILVTDYSSVLFDFLYLDRDIICYAYDLYMYEHEDKGLLIDYQSLPADRVYSLDELKENLQEKVYKRDSHAEDRKRWLKKCFDNRTMDDTIQALLR
jgi:CDP-glycerol glycerophosphotransferase (TagB/SpsB family)